MIVLIIFGTNILAILLRMLCTMYLSIYQVFLHLLSLLILLLVRTIRLGRCLIMAFQPLVSRLLILLLWCTQTLLVLCLQSLTLVLDIFLPSLMIVLGMLFCPFYGPSHTVCLIFTIWSLELRPLLITFLPSCIWTEEVNLWDRSSRHSSLSKVSLIRLLFLTLLNRMDMLRGLIELYWKRQNPCANMPAYLKHSGKML